MCPRPALAASLAVLALGAACRTTTLVDPRLRAAAWADVALAPTSRASGAGAAPVDERGPGRFVDRKEARTFYAAGGGRLWYYLNLYYWAPEGVDTTDLWIKAVVTERFEELARWPDAAPVDPPPPKTTVEYWEVGATGRSMAIDNHKDFWLQSSDWCTGAIDVTMTLELGRVRIRDAKGAWIRPRAHYVLDRRDYGKGGGLAEGDARFEALAREPVTVWGYRIPWSSAPGKPTRSTWEKLDLPRLELRERRVVPRPDASPVLTEDR